MTKIKMCGLRRIEDIEAANSLLPEYIGYVFAQKSRRYITPQVALSLTERLDKRIIPVGVFVNESAENVISIVRSGAVRIAQLHGNEDEAYIKMLRDENITVIKAFIIKSESDVRLAERSSADHILLDAGMGDGKAFNYELIKGMTRPYFLAGGLFPENVKSAVELLSPFAVDVSSGIETDGFKDFDKMKEFTQQVRNI